MDRRPDNWDDLRGIVADFVIVGAGSAGCVLAARLSEDPDTSVVVLEAGGPDTTPELHIPAAFPAVFKSSLDWDLLGEPEPGLGGRRLYLPRGRVIEILPGPEQYALAFWVARRYGASVTHELRDASARIEEARALYVPDPGPLRLPQGPRPRPKGPRPLPPDRSNEPRFPWAYVVGRFAWMLMLWAMIGHSDSPVVLVFLVATVVTVAWFRFQVPMRLRRRRHSKERPKVKRGGLFSRGQRSVVPFYWGWGVKGTRD